MGKTIDLSDLVLINLMQMYFAENADQILIFAVNAAYKYKLCKMPNVDFYLGSTKKRFSETGEKKQSS